MACNRITIIAITLVFLFQALNFPSSNSQETWIRAGYWDSSSELPVSEINSALFTHLLCAFAYINPSTYQLHVNSSKEKSFSAFANSVKHKNPSIMSLLSIWGGGQDLPVFSSMINQFPHRKSFINSSINTARLYGFDGLDLSGIMLNEAMNMTNLGALFDEWRDAVVSESRNTGKSQLLLVMAGYHLPALNSVTYPIDSIRRNLDWVHIVAYDYYVPTRDNLTGAHAALYGKSNWANTDNGIKEWIRRGLSASKLVLGLPYHGYVWRLANPNDNFIGASASGPAITKDGFMGYKAIKSFIQNYGYGKAALYNATLVANFFTVGSSWFNFDDVEAIKAKISYARQNNLIGYNVFHLANDDKWVLSRTAQGKEDKRKKKQPLVPIVVTIAVVLLLVGTIIVMYRYCRRKALQSKGIIGAVKSSIPPNKTKTSDTDKTNTCPTNLQVFSLDSIKEATNNFSTENKLGEGGFGPVYKGMLRTLGEEIAVKRLSKTSHQGVEEFRNEVSLTARLQHVNLVRVLGFCTDREEKMLIYEYMPNKSLDFYLHDPIRRYLLNWRTRVHIIEGITQALLYLQEYSNFTVIHRDLKASNILLDKDMNAKISDFGMARIFRKEELEANTGRIVGTYGYVPPEYVRKGVYSMKYDVFSFGVLLLQIISGKRTNCYYGSHENLNLLEYAYDMWKDGEGKEFTDPSLDDSQSPCKLMRCLQVALLCVQENPLDRPSILEVAVMLKKETAPIATPKRPAFSIKGEEDKECVLVKKFFSIDDAPISEVLPR